MKKVAIIGSGTNIDGFLHGMKDHTVTIVDNERKVNDTTTEVFIFHARPNLELPRYFPPKRKGHQRPYKFHR